MFSVGECTLAKSGMDRRHGAAQGPRAAASQALVDSREKANRSELCAQSR